MMNRRQTIKGLLGASTIAPLLSAQDADCFKIEYVLSSALFGYLPLEDVLPQVNASGASGIDIWRKVHATHREQITAMGDDAFQDLLKRHKTRMHISTCYPLGPFGRDKEMAWVKKNGGKMTVCATRSLGKRDLAGEEAKRQVKLLFEKLKPHL